MKTAHLHTDIKDTTIITDGGVFVLVSNNSSSNWSNSSNRNRGGTMF